MTDLSPQAQAVLDVMEWCYDHEPARRALAAGVLRVAADQVGEWESAEELRAIAAELEGKGND